MRNTPKSNLFALLMIFGLSLLPKPSLANYYCTNLSHDNAQIVFSEIIDFYTNNLGGTDLNAVKAEVEELFESLNLPTVDNQACDRGILIKTGYEYRETAEFGNFSKLLFRWHESSSDCLEFYGSFLDLFTFAKADSTMTVPGATFKVPETTRGKLFALNARCDGSQSAYFIIIIDRDLDLTSLPGPSNQQVSNDGDNGNSGFRLSDNNSSKLELFPNPVLESSAQVTFNIPEPSAAALYLLEGVSGQYIQSILSAQRLPEGEHTQTIPTDHLSPGIHFVVLEVNGKRIVRKLIKL